MPLGNSLKSYTYWGVKDSSVYFSVAIHREKNRKSSSATFCFFTSGLSSLCYGYSRVSFSAFPLVNFFSQHIGYVVTITTTILPGHPYPPSGFFFLWSVWKKRNCFMSITELFPLCTYFLIPSETSTLLVGKHPHPFTPQNIIRSKGYVAFFTEVSEQAT